MARSKGTARFAVNFEPTGQTPLDARLLVPTVADLYTAYNDDKNLYQDMVVTVQENHSQYILIDATKVGSEEGWKRIDVGSVVKTEIVNDLTTGGADKALSAEMGKTLKTELDSFDVVKLETAEEGMAASYQLQKNGQQIGATINIIKDQFVESGSVIDKEGKLVIRLVVNGKNIDIPADALVDKYKGSKYINVAEGNIVSLNYEAVKTKIDTDLGVSTLTEKVTTIESTVNSLDTTVKQHTESINSNISSINNINDRINALDGEDPNSLKSKVTALENTVGNETSGLVKTVNDLKTQVDSDEVTSIDATPMSGVSLATGNTPKSVKVNVDIDTLASSITEKLSGASIKIGKAISGGITANETDSIATVISELAAGGITVIESANKTIDVTVEENKRIIDVKATALVKDAGQSSLSAGEDNKLDLVWIDIQ